MQHAPTGKTMADFGLCSTDGCKAEMRRALFEVAGPGGKWLYEQLADAAGIEERTLKAYVLGECLPSLPVFLRLCAVLGPDFAARFLVMAGVDIKKPEGNHEAPL